MGQIRKRRLCRRARLQSKAGLAAQRPDFLQTGHGVFRSVRLQVDSQPVRSGLQKALGVADGTVNHQMYVQRELRHLPDVPHHRQSDGNIRHKQAVHHVHMNPVGTVFLNVMDIPLQIGKIRGQN